MSYQDYLRRRDNEMADQLGTCQHCGAKTPNVFGLRESEACTQCGYMAWRFTDLDIAYYEAWIAWNQVGGILRRDLSLFEHLKDTHLFAFAPSRSRGGRPARALRLGLRRHLLGGGRACTRVTLFHHALADARIQLQSGLR